MKAVCCKTIQFKPLPLIAVVCATVLLTLSISSPGLNSRACHENNNGGGYHPPPFNLSDNLADQTHEISSDDTPLDTTQDVVCTEDEVELSDSLVTKFQTVGNCQLIKEICWDQGQLVVPYSRTIDVQNLTRTGAVHLYNYMGMVGEQEQLRSLHPDQLKPQQFKAIPVRAFTPKEQQQLLGSGFNELKPPTYSNCKIPVVLFAHQPWSYGTVLQRTGSWMYDVVRSVEDVVKSKLQIAVVMPENLSLPPFIGDLLQPMVEWPVTTFSEASSRDEAGRLSCFKQMIVCQGGSTVNTWQYGEFIAEHYATHQPANVDDDDGSEKTTPQRDNENVIKVVFAAENKSGTRKIDNLNKLQKRCSKTKLSGVTLHCSTLVLQDTATNALALQDVDVLITSHTTATHNAFFLPSGASVIDVIPLDLPRALYAEANSDDPKSQLMWWNLHVCDPASSTHSSFELEQGEKVRDLLPSLRSSRLPWESLETVLQQIVDLDKDIKAYKKLVKSNKHSYFALEDGITRSAKSGEEQLRRCPTKVSEEWVNALNEEEKVSRDPGWSDKYPKHHDFGNELEDGGTNATWYVPAFPREVMVLFNGAKRSASQWFPPSRNCPHCCAGCFEHHRFATMALEMRIALIALEYVEKPATLYPAWTKSSRASPNTELQRVAYDARRDPLQSFDLPKLKRTLEHIIKLEKLQGLRLFVAGFSAGGRAAYMMPAVLPEVQGVIIFSVFSAGNEINFEILRKQNRKYPPVAIIYHPLDSKKVPLIREDIAQLRQNNIPTLVLTHWPYLPTKESLAQFLRVNDTTAKTIFKWFVQKKLIDTDTGDAGWLNWNGNYPPRLASLLAQTFPSVPGCSFAEWMFHIQGYHYIDCTHCQAVLDWLRSGGLERPAFPPEASLEEHPVYKPHDRMWPYNLSDGTVIPMGGPPNCI